MKTLIKDLKMFAYLAIFSLSFFVIYDFIDHIVALAWPEKYANLYYAISIPMLVIVVIAYFSIVRKIFKRMRNPDVIGNKNPPSQID